MILVCFKDIVLGKIVGKGDEIYYSSYPKGEQELKEKYPVAPIYKMFNCENKKLEELPGFLNEFLEMSSNDFYKQLADIKDDDGRYEKLFKIAAINLAKDNFYIKHNKF